MKTILIIMAMVIILTAQTTSRVYAIIPTTVLDQCNPKDEHFDKAILGDLNKIGEVQGGYAVKDHRLSNDGKLAIVEFNRCPDKQEVRTEKIAKGEKVNIKNISVNLTQKIRKQIKVNTVLTDNNTKGHITASYRWVKFIGDDKDIYEYLAENKKLWGGDEEIINPKEIGIEGKK